MAHEPVYSGGGCKEFLWQDTIKPVSHRFVAMTRKFAHGSLRLLQEKPVVNGPMTIPWRGASFVCFQALLQNCEQCNYN